MLSKRDRATRVPRIVLAVAATCLGAVLTWYLFAHKVTQGRSTLLVVSYLTLVWILFRIRVFPTPAGYSVLSWGRTLVLRDVLRFVGCVAGGVACTVLLAPRVSDTEAGAALAIIPGIFLALLGVFFLARAFFRSPRA